MSRLINLQGKKFSRLTVLSLKDSGTDKHARWNCVCDCGKKTISDGYTLRSGHTKSCGCLGAENRKKANTRHGQRQHCLYKTWIQMKQRCENKKDHGYKNYGGRGIKMCDQWHDFANFLRDMGDSFKPGLSIDRINNNYGYCKENCRWATLYQQSRNKRVTHFIEYNGLKLCMRDWSRKLGMNYTTLAARLLTYKWPIEKALTSKIYKR